ncbi:hypothetical protein [Geitlerinema sp. PCC 9228]|uniref:hypothetical protein n=1 Tax=Geitlerinema sp. PCC 9228 TaxID=111611 RepID=UPI0008F9DB59|nr:hypothetical protein [Geitlerinema sp. PCC 9228]
MTSNNTIDRENFFIKEEQVLNGLSLNKEELDSILKKIENLPNKFDWEERYHFRYVNKAQGRRNFSRLGLIVISEYFEFNKELDSAKEVMNLLQRLTREREEKNIDVKIVEKTNETLDDSSKEIVLRRNRHWLKFDDIRKILSTTSLRLKQALESIARSELPLIVEEDFEDIENDRYYSFSGLERICRELQETLTNRYRRLYAGRVPEIAPEVIHERSKRLLTAPPENEVKQAKEAAIKRQKKKCQITGETRKSHELAVHHLYDRSTYSELAADQDNLFVITKEIHQRFHTWHEGFYKTCTIDDFIDFIKLDENPSHSVLTELYERRRNLQNKQKDRFKFRQLEPGSTESQQTQPKGKSQPTTSKPAASQQKTQGKEDSESNADKKDGTSGVNSLLGKNCSAMVGGKKELGVILAIAKDSSVDYIRICFQVNGEGQGKWIYESDLIEE